ncbi:MAG: class I SAM-dependent rRNA methyltransferase [Candidatus Rokubacteria bacterium]|nr:class I SAM-dependent rRNA methyltransferase [Candidatus Rokubacteria bacterium]
MARLILKRGAEHRVNAGHPWIYRTQVADLKGFSQAGEAVEVVDAGGRYLGQGFYNPRPSLCCRLLTRRDEAIDAAFFRRRLEAAWEYRRTAGLVSDAYRLCWSEADGLPGLVVDRYGPVSVVQCLTLGMFKAEGWILAALWRQFPDGSIHRLDEPTAAHLEGFDARQDPAGQELVVTEGDCRFGVTPGAGHKTGLYLDQAENRALVARHADGRRVLDAFCFSGGFACHALRSGATQALLLDSSAAALALARRNLELNGATARAELREGNAFDLLRGLEAAGERFGVVVLDPPPFTRRKDAIEAAARGYKEINIRGLRLLEPGGVLATFSCSHHITPGLFEEICREAAGDAGVNVRVLRTLSQSRDHPVLLTVPESRYLKGLLLEAV